MRFVILTVALAAGQAAHGAAPPSATRPPRAKVDACALLTSADIQGVLGHAVKEQQPGTQPARGLLMSQCFFGTATPESVSVALAAPGTRARSSMTPKKFWKDQFHGAREEDDKDRGRARAAGRGETHENAREREGESNARPIAGVGDEAYWSGTRIAGALYVLSGDRFIRISVGGIRDEAERIAKSKALALLALRRMG